MSAHSDSQTILVVEADILVRQPLVEYLRECGFQVLTAANVREAEELVMSGTSVDVMLANVEHIGAEAFELARWVRLQARPPEIILTGNSEKAVEKAGDLCEEAPGTSPHPRQILLDRIRRALAARENVARGVTRLGAKDRPGRGDEST